MKRMRFLFIAVSLIALFSLSVPKTLAQTSFTDIPSHHWAAEEIGYLSDLGVITGYGNGLFGANDSIKRGDAAIMIARILELDTKEVKKPSFTDVPANHYAYPAIAAVVEAGIFQDGNKFNPNQSLTRAEMAKIMVKTFALKATIKVSFTDTPSSHWAYGDISALAGNGITTGYIDGTFKPSQSITRAEFAALVARTKKAEFRPKVMILPQKMAEQIYYPQIYGLEQKEAQTKINEMFKQHAQAAVAHLQELIKSGQEFNDPLLEHYTVITEYEIKYHQNGQLSILFTDSQYSGGAHGLYGYTAYNVDLNTGEKLQLKDLFSSNYVSIINNEIKRQINVLKQTDQYFELAPFQNIEPNTDRFYLTPSGVVMYFSLYEYTPYAYGIPEYKIPYQLLK
jgi:hypothetical protein